MVDFHFLNCQLPRYLDVILLALYFVKCSSRGEIIKRALVPDIKGEDAYPTKRKWNVSHRHSTSYFLARNVMLMELNSTRLELISVVF